MSSSVLCVAGDEAYLTLIVQAHLFALKHHKNRAWPLCCASALPNAPLFTMSLQDCLRKLESIDSYGKIYKYNHPPAKDAKRLA